MDALLSVTRHGRANVAASFSPERLEAEPADLWESIEGEAEAGRACVWGIDLGDSSAQSAVASYWPASGRLECVAAFPTVSDLTERAVKDGVGRRLRAKDAAILGVAVGTRHGGRPKRKGWRYAGVA